MGALDGLKILEFSEFISGPYCAKMLADLGAEVIKIEKPGSGDSARTWGPFPENQPHSEKSGLFLFLNTNKSSITLDVENEKSRQVFRRLAEWADVLIIDKTQREMAETRLRLSKTERSLTLC